MIGHDSWIYALTLLPNGLLASGSDDGKIMIWNVSESIPLITLLMPNATIRALIIVNNEFLASCSYNASIKLWSLSNYEEVSSWRAGESSSLTLTSLAFDPKLNILVSGGGDKINIWDSLLWTNIKTKPGEHF